MKKNLLLAAVSLVALSAAAPALAADLAARPYTKAPAMVAAIYDWSGFYIGINGGGGSADTSWDLVGFGPEGSHNSTGGTYIELISNLTGFERHITPLLIAPQ